MTPIEYKDTKFNLKQSDVVQENPTTEIMNTLFDDIAMHVTLSLCYPFINFSFVSLSKHLIV